MGSTAAGHGGGFGWRGLLSLVAAVAVSLLAATPALAQGDEVTIRFELVVEGEPPQDATFFGQYLVEGASVRLKDPEGDGVYTGSVSGGLPDAGFRIVRGTGVEKSMTGLYPGQPVTVIEEFPIPDVTGGAVTLSSSVSFGNGDGAGEPALGSVSATGILEKPQVTTYMYGTHAITDEATGTSYALSGETVDLDQYVGGRVTVSGELVPGYDEGQIEGGPPLIEVTSMQPAGDGNNENQQTTVAFEVTIDDEAPENASVSVRSAAVPDGLVCGPGCGGDGATERLEVPMAVGQRFDYEILADPGGEGPAVSVAAGSEVAADGLVIEASHSFASVGEDLNGDGVVDEADEETAAQVIEEARENVDPDKNPLPITGGVALLVLLAGSALAASGYLIHRTIR